MKYLASVLAGALLVALEASSVSSQTMHWQQLPGPEGGTVRSTATAPDGSIYATIDRRGLFRSIDAGASWTPVATPGSADGLYGDIHITSAGSLFLTRYRAAPLRSTDRGLTWDSIEVAISWPAPIANDSSGGVIAVGGSRTLFRSSDDGATWSQLGDDFTIDITALAIGTRGEIILGLLPSGGAVGVSTDKGTTWRTAAIGDDQTSAPIAIATLPDGRLLAAVPGFGIYRSTDVGATWTRQQNVAQPYVDLIELVPDGRLLVVTRDSLFVSTDAATTLVVLEPPVTTLGVTTLTVLRDGRMLVGTDGAGFYVNDGARWRGSSRGLPPAGSAALAASGDGTMYTIGWNRHLHASTDAGTTWSEPNEQASLAPVVAVAPGGALFNAVYDYPRGGVRRSTDRGATWTTLGDSIASEVVVSLHVARSGALYAGVDRGEESFFSSATDGLFRTIDLGATWTTVGAGMERRTARHIVDLSDGTLLLATNRTVMRLDAGDPHWRERSSGLDTRGPINAFAADRRENLFTATGHGLFRSVDRGDTWSRVATEVPDSAFRALVVLRDGRIVAATTNRGVWASSDDGGTWTQLGSPAPLAVEALMVDSTGSLFAASPEYGIYRLEESTAAPSSDELPREMDLTALPEVETENMEFP